MFWIFIALQSARRHSLAVPPPPGFSKTSLGTSLGYIINYRNNVCLGLKMSTVVWCFSDALPSLLKQTDPWVYIEIHTPVIQSTQKTPESLAQDKPKGIRTVLILQNASLSTLSFYFTCMQFCLRRVGQSQDCRRKRTGWVEIKATRKKKKS